MYSLKVYPYRLYFKQPAGTSRGIYTTRDVWYINLTSDEFPNQIVIGEYAPLPNLSCDYSPGYGALLEQICSEVAYRGNIDKNWLRSYPSILFGLETAFAHFEANSFKLADTQFSKGKRGIPINGLIWMGTYNSMFEQVKEKIEQGYHCIKLKIGAINFEEEIKLIHFIRTHFSKEDIEIRVDANGAFKVDEALDKLKRLAEYDLHSIEQPIAANQWEAMARLVEKSPLPIALDEELIGTNDLSKKKLLLDSINPSYIILKPSLHGGISGSNEWIEEANKRNIGWWITSALESNIGLNSIAHWCSTLNNPLPQGLGTGSLFINNINLPLKIQKNSLWFKE